MAKLRSFDSLYNLKTWLLIIQADSLQGKKKYNKIAKPLARPDQEKKKKRERTQITSIRNEIGTAFSFMFISL